MGSLSNMSCTENKIKGVLGSDSFSFANHPVAFIHILHCATLVEVTIGGTFIAVNSYLAPTTLWSLCRFWIFHT